MDGKDGPKETTRVTAPAASTTLSVNVFTAPGKAMVGERPRPFGEALGFDPITSTLIFGEHDAVLVDAMMTVAEAEALADWVALHNRNLETIYITHAHFDHFYGLSILLDRFPSARAIATPRTVNAMQMCADPSSDPTGWALGGSFCALPESQLTSSPATTITAIRSFFMAFQLPK